MTSVARWLDSERAGADGDTTDWARIVPFIALHLACLAVFWVGVSAVAVTVAVLAYALRMFAITAFYHRYFAHRAFRASRWTTFWFALLGTTATQRGPLWWAAHHRQHHRAADTDEDTHDSRRGFWWSHIGWFVTGSAFRRRDELIRDWLRYPELRWLDRFDWVGPVLFGLLMFALGSGLEHLAPAGSALANTSGMQMFVWGYVISTVVLIHATLLVNSCGHRFGRRNFETDDASRNCWWLALLTFGEGWHNNHHRYAGAARQGFTKWEPDLSWLLLCGLQRLGIVSGLKDVPERVMAERQS